METGINEIHRDLLKLKRDIEIIKYILLSEGEISSWAKKNLKKSREEPEESYTNLNELWAFKQSSQTKQLSSLEIYKKGWE